MRKGRQLRYSDDGGATAIGIVCASVAIGRGAGAAGADYLACAEGTDSKVSRPAARDAGHGLQMARAVHRGSIGRLYDEPRPGAKRSITDAQVEDVIIRTLETTPRGATHWSTRGMAKAVGLSHTAISRIWHTFGLQPHRSETFKLSNDPLLVEKVRDIVACICIPPRMRPCSASTRNRRSKPSTARSRCCRCNPDKWSAGRMTTNPRHHDAVRGAQCEDE